MNVITISLYTRSYEKLASSNIIMNHEASIRSLLDLVDDKLEGQLEIALSISSNKRIEEIVDEKAEDLLKQIQNAQEVEEIFFRL